MSGQSNHRRILTNLFSFNDETFPPFPPPPPRPPSQPASSITIPLPPPPPSVSMLLPLPTPLAAQLPPLPPLPPIPEPMPLRTQDLSLLGNSSHPCDRRTRNQNRRGSRLSHTLHQSNTNNTNHRHNNGAGVGFLFESRITERMPFLKSSDPKSSVPINRASDGAPAYNRANSTTLPPTVIKNRSDPPTFNPTNSTSNSNGNTKPNATANTNANSNTNANINSKSNSNANVNANIGLGLYSGAGSISGSSSGVKGDSGEKWDSGDKLGQDRQSRPTHEQAKRKREITNKPNPRRTKFKHNNPVSPEKKTPAAIALEKQRIKMQSIWPYLASPKNNMPQAIFRKYKDNRRSVTNRHSSLVNLPVMVERARKESNEFRPDLVIQDMYLVAWNLQEIVQNCQKEDNTFLTSSSKNTEFKTSVDKMLSWIKNISQNTRNPTASITQAQSPLKSDHHDKAGGGDLNSTYETGINTGVGAGALAGAAAAAGVHNLAMCVGEIIKPILADNNARFNDIIDHSNRQFMQMIKNITTEQKKSIDQRMNNIEQLLLAQHRQPQNQTIPCHPRPIIPHSPRSTDPNTLD